MSKRSRQSEPLIEAKRLRLSSVPLHEWSPSQVYQQLLKQNISSEVAGLFQTHEISGKQLFKLSRADLSTMGIKKLGIQDIIMTAIEFLVGDTPSALEKVFNDPIHGHIELHPLMVKIIDTPQFQRLRNIKQLGGGYYVFMGASHNRFEHSIGVGFLAGELVETLQRKQPELHISYKDVLCVKIAGLCHDLGHGPFSHLFDSRFIPKVKPGTSWKHEQASVMMFNHLLEVNSLHSTFGEHGLDDSDILFIKELIAGPDPNRTECNDTPASNWPYKGRPEDKSFLYEIVANKRTGIDVDKWDYFARDCHCLGIPNGFDLKRYLKFARVLKVNSRKQICTRDKEVGNLYEMFHTRACLHRRAYQHKTVNIVEHMITEALVKADEHLKIPAKEGYVKMSEAIDDPYAYTRLTDNVIHQIITSSDLELQESKKILLDVEYRRLYKCIGQAQYSSGTIGNEKSVAEEIINEDLVDVDGKLTKEDLIVEVITYDYGMNEEDPINHMRFYRKENPTKPVQISRAQVSQMLPQTFKEQKICVYSKCLDKDGIQLAKSYFMSWCQKNGYTTPKENEDALLEDSIYITTPIKGELQGKNTLQTESKRKLF